MSPIQELHDLYCHLTGLQLRYMPLEHDSDWFLWSKLFSAEDLQLVVPWLKKAYKDKPQILRSTLMFRHLIRCRDYFGEYLAQAKWEARAPKPLNRDKVLAATGRKQEQPDNTTTPAQILQGSGLPHTPNPPEAGFTSPATPALHSLPPRAQKALDELKKEMGW